MTKNLLRKMWYDARFAHTNYLMFLLVFVNFILIAYNFLLEDNTGLNNIFSNLWVFTLVFLILYIPISVIIGRWHTQNQIKVEHEMRFKQNPMFSKMIRTLMDVKTGRASEEEIEKFRKMLTDIEKKDINEF